jgi:hypothetical protein
MSEGDKRRFITLGTFDGGLPDIFEIPAEPLRKIEAGLEAERAEAERVRLAALADAERARNTRGARAMRRFKRALQTLTRTS